MGNSQNGGIRVTTCRGIPKAEGNDEAALNKESSGTQAQIEAAPAPGLEAGGPGPGPGNLGLAVALGLALALG